MVLTPRSVIAAAALVALGVGAVTACGGEDDTPEAAAFAADVYAAMEAVEAELGADQDYFEVTASSRLTNVFVAIDDATTAVPYVYLDGELQPPAPSLEGVSGYVFSADDVSFDEDAVASQVAVDVPDATVESLSVEGGADGSVRYVLAVRSPAGGVLDVTVADDGAVLSVDPV